MVLCVKSYIFLVDNSVDNLWIKLYKWITLWIMWINVTTYPHIFFCSKSLLDKSLQTLYYQKSTNPHNQSL
ncbi:hypothetical protein [Dipodfec virus UOA04_Rod_1057]|nr:hypothetical protein [Dipodfec virus UOA04_Rod_1057]